MKIKLIFILILSSILFAGCIDNSNKPDMTLSGTIKADGSSTVFPITEAVSEEFGNKYPNIRVTAGISGTGGGFKKFCAGETDLNDASREIREPEKELCSKNGIEWIELKVAFDGLSVVVNPQNTWAESLTVEELKKIWGPESKITTWKDIRQEWPSEKIILVGADTDSGTFDYFTEAIVGKEKSSRSDYTASSDDNVLVQAVSGEKYSLGYFGYAYYFENKNKLKLVSIDNGKGAVLPSHDTISDGTYSPLSRPLYVYVNKNSLKRPEVKEFITYYLTEGKEFVPQVGYIKMPESDYDKELMKTKS